MLNNQPSSQSHSEEEERSNSKKDSIAIVPLAMPMVAGPGAISTALVAANEQAGHMLSLFLLSAVCVAIGVVFALCFRFASPAAHAIGVSGVAIVTRLMGLVLAAIACGMIATGLTGLFPGLA